MENRKIEFFYKNHKICVKVATTLISFLIYFQIFEILKKVKFGQFWSCDPPPREKIGDFLRFFRKFLKI